VNSPEVASIAALRGAIEVVWEHLQGTEESARSAGDEFAPVP